MVLHKGVLEDPVRIYGNEKLAIVTSEIPLPVEVIRTTARVLASWLHEKGVELTVSISGIPTQNRLNIETPLVFGVANSRNASEILRSKGIEVMEEGFIAGVYALILKECKKIGMPAVALLAQSFLKYPDPGAAASALISLNKITGIDMDVKVLLEKADEIRIKARDLMRQAEGAIEGMKKPTEQAIPIMYR